MLNFAREGLALASVVSFVWMVVEIAHMIG